MKFLSHVSLWQTNSSHPPGCVGPQKETIVFQPGRVRWRMVVDVPPGPTYPVMVRNPY